MTNILVGESDCRAEDPMAGAHYSFSYVAYPITYIGCRLFYFPRRVLTTLSMDFSSRKQSEHSIIQWTRRYLQRVVN